MYVCLIHNVSMVDICIFAFLFYYDEVNNLIRLYGNEYFY